MFKLRLKKLPSKEPLIKLAPIIKLIGNLIVSLIKKLTLLLLELFCIPTIKKRNKQELKAVAKIIFFNMTDINLIFMKSNLNYKLCFF